MLLPRLGRMSPAMCASNPTRSGGWTHDVPLAGFRLTYGSGSAYLSVVLPPTIVPGGRSPIIWIG